MLTMLTFDAVQLPGLTLGLFFGLPGGAEWIILLIIALLIFGRRLPEVGRSLGRGIVEFKKGIRGIEEEVEQESSRPSPPRELPKSNPPAERIEERNPYAAEVRTGAEVRAREE